MGLKLYQTTYYALESFLGRQFTRLHSHWRIPLELCTNIASILRHIFCTYVGYHFLSQQCSVQYQTGEEIAFLPVEGVLPICVNFLVKAILWSVQEFRHCMVVKVQSLHVESFTQLRGLHFVNNENERGSMFTLRYPRHMFPTRLG